MKKTEEKIFGDLEPTAESGAREAVPEWISEALIAETIRVFKSRYGGTFDRKDALDCLIAVGALIDVVYENPVPVTDSKRQARAA